MLTEWDLMIREMIKFLIEHPDITLEEIGCKTERIETPFGELVIIK